MRTSKLLLVIVAIFIVTLLIIIIIKIPSGAGALISLFLLASFIAVYHLAKYLGETTPQNLVEGKEYKFIGVDNQKGWLFLEEHIHNDAVIPNNIPTIAMDGTINQNPIMLPEEDYDLPGIYKGELFNHGIEPGATVVVIKNTDGRMGIVLAPAA